MNAWPRALVIITAMICVTVLLVATLQVDPKDNVTHGAIAALAAAVGYALRHVLNANPPKPP